MAFYICEFTTHGKGSKKLVGMKALQVGAELGGYFLTSAHRSVGIVTRKEPGLERLDFLQEQFHTWVQVNFRGRLLKLGAWTKEGWSALAQKSEKRGP